MELSDFMGLRISGLGFRGLGFRIQSLGYRLKRFRAQIFGCRNVGFGGFGLMGCYGVIGFSFKVVGR